MANKRFYWLKLKKDFFKRHDIQILESMPNGKEYVLFYLKLLCESIDHNGKLRFSDDLSYSDDMLAIITNTDKNITCDALTELNNLGLIEMLEDGTFYLKQVENMIGQSGQDEHTRESTRQRVKAFRERKKQCNTDVTLQKRYSNVTCNGEKEIDIDIDKDIKVGEKRKRFIPPTLEDVQAYCQERNNKVDPKRFFDYYEQGGWKDSKGNPVKNWKQKLITWENKEPKPEPKKHFGTERTNIDYEELLRKRVVN